MKQHRFIAWTLWWVNLWWLAVTAMPHHHHHTSQPCFQNDFLIEQCCQATHDDGFSHTAEHRHEPCQQRCLTQLDSTVPKARRVVSLQQLSNLFGSFCLPATLVTLPKRVLEDAIAWASYRNNSLPAIQRGTTALRAPPSIGFANQAC